MLSPGMRLGPYEIREPIGTGGMGEVYRARDARLERDVAIKVLPEALARDAVGKLIGSEVPNVRRRPGVQPKEKRHVEPPRDEAPGG